mmetsp:Transcript_1812/g.5283  ORF Transcript_1812/g.5283 Transcript_1812/m.5283 type:complete len:248 (+) Transcript_1812:2281-3024(+)
MLGLGALLATLGFKILRSEGKLGFGDDSSTNIFLVFIGRVVLATAVAISPSIGCHFHFHCCSSFGFVIEVHFGGGCVAIVTGRTAAITVLLLAILHQSSGLHQAAYLLVHIWDLAGHIGTQLLGQIVELIEPFNDGMAPHVILVGRAAQKTGLKHGPVTFGSVRSGGGLPRGALSLEEKILTYVKGCRSFRHGFGQKILKSSISSSNSLSYIMKRVRGKKIYVSWMIPNGSNVCNISIMSCRLQSSG